MKTIPLFIESHNRIKRAQEHADAFTNTCTEFLHDKPYGIKHDIRDDRNGIIRLVPQKYLPWDLPLILGEYFYQLRAALDGAMWKAYTLCGRAQNTPKIRDGDVYFPICETSKSLKKAAFKRMALPDDLGVWLDSIQPYNRTEVTSEITDNLLLISKRSAIDRHRQLHLVGVIVRSDTPLITLSPPAVTTQVREIAADPLKGEYVICEFSFEGIASETKIDVNANFALNIKIEEVTDNVEIIVKLRDLTRTVQGVIERFETAFS